MDEDTVEKLLNMSDEEAADILQRFYEQYAIAGGRKNGKTFVKLPVMAALSKALYKVRGGK